MKRNPLALFVLVVRIALNGSADVVIRTQVEPANGHPACGSNVTFSVLLMQKDSETPVADKAVQYEVTLNGKRKITSETLDSATVPVSISLPTEKDAWYLARFRPVEEIEAPRDNMTPEDSSIGAVTCAKDFRSAIPEPEDFDAFWAKTLADLEAVPMKSTETEIEIPEKWKGKLRIYDIKVDCPGGAPVSGYLTVPEGASPRSLPVIVRYPGAGIWSASRYYDEGVITLGINGHGIENGKSKAYYEELENGLLRNYSSRNNDNPDTCYFRGIFLRAVRALDYVMGRPEWNGRDLIVYGGSMGGAQAIAVSALRPEHVTLCVTHFPAMCDHAGSLADNPRMPGWPQAYYADTSKPMPEKTREIMACMNYYDTIHFGRRLKCPFHTSIGYTDTLTPPIGIHALVNNINPELVKSVMISVKQGHGGVFSRTGEEEIKKIINSTTTKGKL